MIKVLQGYAVIAVAVKILVQNIQVAAGAAQSQVQSIVNTQGTLELLEAHILAPILQKYTYMDSISYRFPTIKT